MSLSFGPGQVAMAGGLLNRMGFTPAGIAACWCIGAVSVSAATKTVLSIFVVVERLAAAVSSFVRTTAAAENPLSAIQSAAATAASTAARSSLIGAVALIGVVTALLSSWVNWCYTSAGTATLAALKWINHGPGVCARLAAVAATAVPSRK